MLACLPFVVSGMVPSISTDFPMNAPASPEVSDSGTRGNSSFEPEIRSWAAPFITSTLPSTVSLESFIVNPFFVMALCSCFSVVVLFVFIFTEARPLARPTSTESTPDTDFNDTRTACAQTSQSMPKILMSMDLISADAEAANISSVANSVIAFFISSPSVSAGIADN